MQMWHMGSAGAAYGHSHSAQDDMQQVHGCTDLHNMQMHQRELRMSTAGLHHTLGSSPSEQEMRAVAVVAAATRAAAAAVSNSMTHQPHHGYPQYIQPTMPQGGLRGMNHMGTPPSGQGPQGASRGAMQRGEGFGPQLQNQVCTRSQERLA